MEDEDQIELEACNQLYSDDALERAADGLATGSVPCAPSKDFDSVCGSS